ncbi:MAG: ABC transporter ATP-binding protein [Candidatus Puniceispirillaceae bacterium]|jgi:putative ABC transport system ATP-binding protein|nr:ABC transporter ATP-binding protein [Pseudomonadota bacterium]GIS12586.1 MAG: ABC transporter [Alphaproteobacteria bacterium]MEC7171019.1 ABC transporter ATP-binding protein [Pseudomonadota bacterium]MEC7372031.1 ABC transporter ATP-binding protein [Pseudomonadota bacterium]MEC7439566.1 ABC transporter ATP-binding protein [Pseudomonadota bacterium]|tara:strand:- start:4404 stop:5150 length:747 start_codon:yes stop_codon:yes gene_type:complete
MTDHTVSSPSSEKAHQSAAPVIMLDEARLALSSAEGMVEILRGISLSIEAGETVGVLGPSGAGKTSLLMIMAGLESLTGGSISLAENDITTMGEDALAALRRDQVGIVFQAFRLIPSMTALQNVAVPMELAGRRDADEMAATALEAVGLGHRKTHLPDQMSGGEQQRVAIARAIATRPRILLADEPTGNLDSGTSEKVIATLFEATKSAGAALVLVTHDADLAERCERVLTIEDGRIVGDRKTKAGAA